MVPHACANTRPNLPPEPVCLYHWSRCQVLWVRSRWILPEQGVQISSVFRLVGRQPFRKAPSPLLGTEMAQLVCGGCHTLLMYIRGATSLQCSCCHTINLATEANQVAHVNCGNCRTLLMYQYGARSVKCSVCNFVTSVGAQQSPTTGKFPFAPNNSKSLMLTSVTTDNNDEHKFEDVDTASFVFKPHVDSSSSHFPIAANKADLPGPSIGKDNTSNSRALDGIVCNTNSTPGVTSEYSPPRSDQQDGEGGYQRGEFPSMVGGTSSEDGYNWRKYGQKQVKGSEPKLLQVYSSKLSSEEKGGALSRGAHYRDHIQAESHSIYIRGLPLNATVSQLEEFKKFGVSLISRASYTNPNSFEDSLLPHVMHKVTFEATCCGAWQ